MSISKNLILSNSGESIIIKSDISKGILLRGYENNDFSKLKIFKNDLFLDNDKILEGAEAFLLVWKKIPKYKFLYKFFKIPIIFTIFDYGYEIIAYFLYLKNKKQLKKLS